MVTPDIATVERFSEIVQTAIGEIVNSALEVLDPTPGRVVHLAPGSQVAHDNCCDGQLWGRLVNVQPSAAGVSNPTKIDPCHVPFLSATLELGIVRCAAVLDNEGRAPSPEAITLDGAQSIDDMAALLAALRCSGRVRSLTGWTPTGPEGGCHGGYWTFSVRLDNCIQCGGE